MYMVTEAAQLIGVSAGTLRLWERQGLIQPRRDGCGRRVYSDSDVARLRKIAWWRRVRGDNAAAIRRLLESEDYAELDQPIERNTPAPSPPTGMEFRARRRRNGLTLKQVSERSGLSVSFISAAERGTSGLSPSARARLLSAVHGDGHVDVQQDSTGHRLGDGKRVDIAPGITYEWLSNYHGLMEPQLARIQPGAQSDSTYQHDGEEILIVLMGCLELALNGTVQTLGARDTIHFNSHTPHSWANRGAEEAEVLWITTERGIWSTGKHNPTSEGKKQ